MSNHLKIICLLLFHFARLKSFASIVLHFLLLKDLFSCLSLLLLVPVEVIPVIHGDQVRASHSVTTKLLYQYNLNIANFVSLWKAQLVGLVEKPLYEGIFGWTLCSATGIHH